MSKGIIAIQGPLPNITLSHISDTDAAWLGAWISSDGSIAEKSNTLCRGAVIKFTLTDKDPLDRIVEIIGRGSVSGPTKPTGFGKKQRYHLSYSSHVAAAIVHRCWRWLSKRRQGRYNEIASKWTAYGYNGHKLNKDDVIAIKEALKNPYHGISKALAKKYGVSDGMICHIKHNRQWITEESPKKVIYIAGKMRTIPFYNFPAFMDKDRELTLKGWSVINPAQIDLDNGLDPYTFSDDFDWDNEPLNIDLRVIVERDCMALIWQCDAIYMLSGWEKSVGAKAEHALAKWCGLDIYYEED